MFVSCKRPPKNGMAKKNDTTCYKQFDDIEIWLAVLYSFIESLLIRGNLFFLSNLIRGNPERLPLYFYGIQVATCHFGCLIRVVSANVIVEKKTEYAACTS